jgi:putative ABC transport system permease protein
MSYFRLIWSGLWRKPMRTIFTLLSIAVAFMLFGALQGVNAAFNRVVELAPIDVLLTKNPHGLSLPLAALPQIQQISGVTAVSYQSGFLGYFQSAGNIVPVSAVDPEHLHLTMGDDFSVPNDQLAKFRRTQTGALISARLAERLHWNIGDRVPVQAISTPTKDGSTVWTFDIVGIYGYPSNPGQLGLVMQYRYLDAARAQGDGTVQIYFEKVADPSKATEVANAIDGRFANSAYPTRTDTERGYAHDALSQIGDLGFFVDTIIGAAFATLLLLIGSNMMQSFRERIPEFAVMKTIGFRDGTLAGLVMCEAVLLCTGAAAIGLLMVSALLAEVGRATAGNIPSVNLPWAIGLYGIVTAAAIALSSALPAAWHTKRLSIVAALAVQ